MDQHHALGLLAMNIYSGFKILAKFGNYLSKHYRGNMYLHVYLVIRFMTVNFRTKFQDPIILHT